MKKETEEVLKKYKIVSIEPLRTSIGKEFQITTRRGKSYVVRVRHYSEYQNKVLWEAVGYNFMNRSDSARFPKSIGYVAQALCHEI